MQLTERDWIVIMNLILMMNETNNCDEMRLNVMKAFRRLIPYELASFYLTDPTEGHLLKDPLSIGFPEGQLEWFIENCEDDSPLAWTNEYPRNLVIRDTDMMAPDTRRENWYYRLIKERFDVDYFLTISMAHNGSNVGLLTLFRTSSGTDFTEEEMFIASQVIDHLALRLYHLTQENRITNTLAQLSRHLHEIAYANGLSNREADVFVLLCKNKKLEDISEELCISEATLKKHIGSIYKKLHIRNRYELMGIVMPELNGA